MQKQVNAVESALARDTLQRYDLPSETLAPR